MSLKLCMDLWKLYLEALLPANEISSLILGFHQKSWVIVTLNFYQTTLKPSWNNWVSNIEFCWPITPNSAAELKLLWRQNTPTIKNRNVSCLDKDCFLLVIMKLRNNPDWDCNLSPAQVVFERPINDAFAFASCLEKLINKNMGPLQIVAWIRKEEALWESFYDYEEKHNKHSCSLLRLNPGILGSLF